AYLLLSSPITFQVTGVTVNCARALCAPTTQNKRASKQRRAAGAAPPPRVGRAAASLRSLFAARLKGYSSSCLRPAGFAGSPFESPWPCALLRGVPKRSKRFESLEEIVK